jgi:hypothetical protein
VEPAVPQGGEFTPQNYHGHKKDDQQKNGYDKIKKKEKVFELQELFSFGIPMLNSMIRDWKLLSTTGISQNPACFGRFSEKTV